MRGCSQPARLLPTPTSSRRATVGLTRKGDGVTDRRTLTHNLRFALVLLGIGALAVACARSPWELSGRTASPPLYGFRVVNAYPHDPRARTQGLVYRDGFLFESTGLKRRSTLRRVRLESGEVVQQRALNAKYYAEGLTDWGNRLVQLTWLSNTGLLYDLRTFREQGRFTYSREGWGLTHDQRRLIVSDGSSRLRFLDPTTFRVIGYLDVKEGTEPVENLNELEYVRNEIFANVWRTDRIARIDPRSGQVIGWVDLSGLLPAGDRADSKAVLNGIAYDAATDRLFVTGKGWPRLFEIALERRP